QFTEGTTTFVGGNTTFDCGPMPVEFDNIVMATGITLTLGGGGSGTVTIGSISGTLVDDSTCPSNIIINTTGAVSILRTIGTNIGSLTVTNSGGATFAGTVDTVTSVVLTATTGTIAFNAALTTPSLSSASAAFNVALNASSGSVSDAATLSHTGTLTLGASGGTLSFAGGLVATAPSAITLNGTLTSNSAAISLGSSSKTITLGSNAVINTYADAGAGGALNFGAIQATTANAQSLTLKT
ncbi:MAG: hypothetical protein JZU63_00195, partial [Rhodoferax sp.]|nr:hypothetical protein [Rhodoferax sp.]